MEFIEYTRNSATFEQIQNHLLECNDLFVPPLSLKVEIPAYSQKLITYAVNFEAWNETKLIGLVSVYLNDSHNRLAFISNVSIISTFAGKGIATVLLKECITYARNLQFEAIGLEVSLSNTRALNLYMKLGFKEVGESNGIMNLKFEITRK
ncbi:MAG: GNAT family N-acetyltransferase [Chryseolinea sp.]